MTLEYITHCGKSWMVGLNGKNITNEPAACSGKLGNTPYVGFGGEQIAAALPVAKLAPCHLCGELVEVKSAIGKKV